MKCPYCETVIQIPEVVRQNVLVYDKDQTIPAPCCGKGIVVSPVKQVRVRASVGAEREDNWGDTISSSTRDEVKNHEAQYA